MIFLLYFVDNGHVEKEEFVHYFTEVRLIDIFRIGVWQKYLTINGLCCRWFIVVDLF